MTKVRNWKERFDLEAEFVFTKSLRYGDGYVYPGDRVPKEEIKAHRLRVWWNGGFISRADSATAPKREEIRVEQRGAWYRLTFPDGTQKNIRKSQLKEYGLDGTQQ
jgi:hypothetical protein